MLFRQSLQKAEKEKQRYSVKRRQIIRTTEGFLSALPSQF